MGSTKGESQSADPAIAHIAAEVVAAVRASAKYRHVAPALVETLAVRELAAGARPKDAVKSVKNKLHQVAGAYQVEPLQGDAWLAEVQTCIAHGGDVRPLCRSLMARHASTRERLSILDEFYPTLFGDLPHVNSVLDLACGLNPLALSWMGLAPDAVYHACDIYADQVELINRWFAIAGQSGEAFLCDLVTAPPALRADVVLLLKAIPCLQQMDHEIGRRLLDTIDAPTIIISYPAHSLGGRKHGMPEQYAAQFARFVEGRAWQVEPFHFTTELVYRIRR